MVSLAPLVNPLFRLEEKHGRSGEDEVIVPAGESKWKMDKQFTVRNLAILYFQLNDFVALREYRVNDRITVQSSRDAEHVPGAVGEVGFPVRVDFEVCGDA